MTHTTILLSVHDDALDRTVLFMSDGTAVIHDHDQEGRVLHITYIHTHRSALKHMRFWTALLTHQVDHIGPYLLFKAPLPNHPILAVQINPAGFVTHKLVFDTLTEARHLLSTYTPKVAT